MCDVLLQSALTYQSLLNVRYHITIARKNKLKVLVIGFPIESYHHLAGFHYTGIDKLKNRRKALDIVLRGEVTIEDIEHARVLDSIIDRLEAIIKIPSLLEEGRAAFHYRGHEQPWSDIVADYLMTISLEKDSMVQMEIEQDYISMFLFVVEDKDVLFSPVSIFLRPDNDYIKNCPQYKILQVIQENVESEERRIVFESPSYRK